MQAPMTALTIAVSHQGPSAGRSGDQADDQNDNDTVGLKHDANSPPAFTRPSKKRRFHTLADYRYSAMMSALHGVSVPKFVNAFVRCTAT
jgi:hypothetical protein